MKPINTVKRNKGLPGSFVCYLLGALFGLLACSVVLGAAADTTQVFSRFQRTALALQEQSPDLVSVFAQTSLLEMIEVYFAEADLARDEASQEQRSGPDKAKLMSWSAAVDRYAADLLSVLSDIEEGAPVKLHNYRSEAIALAIAGRLIILSHPRHAQQGAYEQRVLSTYCSRNDCGRLTGTAALDVSLADGQIIRPQWQFTEQGPRCSHRSMAVQFVDASQIAMQRSICQQLFEEVEALAGQLSWQIQHGVVIDWSRLSIQSTPGRTDHIIVLNSAGDSILQALPLMFASTGLLHDLRNWLQAYSEGQKVQQRLLNGSDYGWASGRK